MFDIGGLFAGAKQPLAGLDIGSSSIKLAEIQSSSKGHVLTRFFQIPLAKGVIVDGSVVQHDVLSKTIKDLFKQSGCKRRRVVASLSGHDVIVKKVTFNQMDENELRDLIRDEAGKYLPFENMDGVDYDCQILGENPYNPSQMEVLLVAAKKELVEGYTEAIEDAGLNPTIMDVDCFALETMYEENYDFEPEDVAILINIGSSMTNLNAVKGATSIFTRDFNLGSNAVTEAISAALSLPIEQAEKAKIEGWGEDAESRNRFREGVIQYADGVSSEIERSVDYFRSTFGAENVKKVLLSGGGAMIPGLAADLAQRLGIETELINPFRKVNADKAFPDKGQAARIGPVAAVAVGLALRKRGDKA